MAKHTLGSIRVLEECGFITEREERAEFAGEEVAELVFVLLPLTILAFFVNAWPVQLWWPAPS